MVHGLELIQGGRKPQGSYQIEALAMENAKENANESRSLAETPAKAKEDDNGANSNMSIEKDDEREQRSFRLSEILGEGHDGYIGLDSNENAHDPTNG
ncbi:hypothetical protein V6N13_140290 [Hibiscus sabdariffa]|uniref:Uncharacterized protein n=1 Tax=Hibiscus sabdariffa TaxID=183260 RepID=A0ABR2QAZ7_9ROSI